MAERSADARVPGTAAFIIGAGVMAVELTASRLLAPYFGASMFVWTSLILTVLVSLAAGYWFGGALAEKGAGLETVGVLLCGTGALLFVGLALLPVVAVALSSVMLSLTTSSIALLLGSFAATAVAFAAPVFLLAVAGPIVLKAWSAGRDVGATSGRYFAVSTAGSVLGTIAPTVLLVPAIGSRRTIELVAALFIVLGAALLPSKRRMHALVFVLPTVLWTGLNPAPATQKVVAEKESSYQLIRVAEEGATRYLTFNEGLGFQSVYTPGDARTGYYYDYFSLLPLLRRGADGGPPRTAVIGLAGGSAAREFGAFVGKGERVDLTGVEVDPAVIDVAKRYFALDDLPVKVVNEDGRMFLRGAGDPYDVIAVDAYSTQLYIPPHLATEEFFSLAHSRLAAGGMLVMNINAADPDSPLLRTLQNTVASRFKEVRVVPIPGAWNWLLFASDAPIPLEDAAKRLTPEWQDLADATATAYGVAYDPAAPTFTDDRAPVEFLTDAMVVKAALAHRFR